MVCGGSFSTLMCSMRPRGGRGRSSGPGLSSRRSRCETRHELTPDNHVLAERGTRWRSPNHAVKAKGLNCRGSFWTIS